MTTTTLELPRSISQNKLHTMLGSRWGRSSYKSHRNGLQLLIRQQALTTMGGPVWSPIEPGKRRRSAMMPGDGDPVLSRVTFTRWSSGTLDDPNLVGGLKPMIDALVLEGLIWDDCPEWYRGTYRQEKSAPKQGRTVVVITWGN